MTTIDLKVIRDLNHLARPRRQLPTSNELMEMSRVRCLIIKHLDLDPTDFPPLFR
jgi:hypothetical protein